MANKTGVTPNKLFGVGARGSEGSKPGPKVNPPTMDPTGPGNPASLSATDMQTHGVKGAPDPRYC